MTNPTKQLVTVEVENWAVPQIIAPKGRWTFRLRGRGFEVEAPNYMPSYSPRGAETAGRKLAARLGFDVRKVNVEKLNVR